jgi:hypothetical protein
MLDPPSLSYLYSVRPTVISHCRSDPLSVADIKVGQMKLRNAMKVWKGRWFVLRQHRLLYFKEEKVRGGCR